MVRSNATTVAGYLQDLPPERRAVVATVRKLVLDNLPDGYQETMNWGMISYEIPLERYPHTYNGQPLAYLMFAAQKHHYALYLMSVYQDPEQERWMREAFKQAGKKLDMGKSCLRFRKLEDLPLDVIGQLVASTPPADFITKYESIRQK